MPNWCLNRLTVSGAVGDLSEFRLLAAGRPAPYSDEVNATDDGRDTPRLPLALHALVPVPPEVLRAGFAMAGYEWQCQHWGVKWELDDGTTVLEIEGELTYTFETAWVPPDAWLAAVASDFPWLRVTLVHLEPGLMFAGHVTYEAGRSVERLELADDPARLSAFGKQHFGWDPYDDAEEALTDEFTDNAWKPGTHDDRIGNAD